MNKQRQATRAAFATYSSPPPLPVILGEHTCTKLDPLHNTPVLVHKHSTLSPSHHITLMHASKPK